MEKNIFFPTINHLAVGNKTKKKDSNAQEAHEAIRPTDIERNQLPSTIDNRARRLYQSNFTKHTRELYGSCSLSYN